MLKGQVAGGGGYGVPKDKLLEVEARGTKGLVAGSGATGQVAGGGS